MSEAVDTLGREAPEPFRGHAADDDRRYRRAPIPARARTASEGSGDVVQGAHQANLLLAREPVNARP